MMDMDAQVVSSKQEQNDQDEEEVDMDAMMDEVDGGSNNIFESKNYVVKDDEDDEDNVKKVRKYDLSITYDFFH